MGCFSWVRAEATTSRSNLCEGDGYKILVPIEFGGGYIKDIYPQYGDIFIYASEPNAEKLHAKGYFKYYDAEGNVTDFYELRQAGGRWDLYGVLAYWNGCKDLLYSGDAYPVTMVDILLNGMTDHQDNRHKGIEVGCGDGLIDKLKYPLKLVSLSYKGTYEECKGRSYTDPDQGFREGKWAQHIYEKYLMKLEDLELDIEPTKSEIQVSEKKESLSDMRSSISRIESIAERFEDDDMTHDILLDIIKSMNCICDLLDEELE